MSYQVDPAINPGTKQIQDLLRVGLKRVNPELTPRDLSLITFQGGRLSVQESAPVFAHIMVGEVELIKNLFVSMAPPTAHDIVNKITQSNLSVPWQSQHRVDAPAGIWVLQQALRQVNPTLSREDVAQITFSAEKQLIVNVAIPVLATVNTGRDTASKLVLVTMQHPCAHDIASKIMHHRITVSMQEDPDVKALKTTIAIRTSLQRVNPSLSNVDLEKISFRGGFLATATEVPVGGLVVVGTQQAHFKLLVTMLQGSAADIIAKITCYRVKIGWQVDACVNERQTTAHLRRRLQFLAPELEDRDIVYLTFEGEDLVAGVFKKVTVIATVGEASAYKTLEVMMEQPEAGDIARKINVSSFNVHWESCSALTNPRTIAAIKQGLQRANPKLTTADLSHFSFFGEPLVVLANVRVNARITTVHSLDTVELIVMMQSELDFIHSITSKLSRRVTVNFQASPVTTNPVTSSAIKQALKQTSRDLSWEELNYVSFQPQRLMPHASVNVTVIVTIGAYHGEQTISVLMQGSRVQQVNQRIKCDVFNLSYQRDVHVTTPTTASHLKARLQALNPELTTADLRCVRLESGVLQVATPVTVGITITAEDEQLRRRLTISMLPPTTPGEVTARVVNDRIKIKVQCLAGWFNLDTHRRQLLEALSTANPLIQTSDWQYMRFCLNNWRREKPHEVFLVKGHENSIKLVVQVGVHVGNVTIRILPV